MSEDIIKKLELKKLELEKTLSDEESLMREFSQKVSKCQIVIIECRAEIKVLDKLLKDINPK